jgi:hypothetical protein
VASRRPDLPDGTMSDKFLYLCLRAAFVTATLLATAFSAAAQAASGTISVGQATVQGSAIKPYRTSFKILAVKDGVEQEAGSFEDAISIIEANGVPAVRRVQIIRTARGVLTDTSVAMKDTLAPLSHNSQNAAREMSLNFNGKHITGSIKPSQGEAKAIEETLEAPAFDSSLLDIIVRALPLRDKYSAQIPVYIQERGGTTWAKCEVIGSEVVTLGDKTKVETWVVEMTLPASRTTFRIAKDTREMVRMTHVSKTGAEMRLTR